MTDMPQVRVAMPDDEDELMELCRELHTENALFPMSERKVRDTLWVAFAKRGGIIGVIGEPGKIQGLIYLLIASQWYTDEWHLEELLNYVRPAYRKSNNAKALISFAQDCAVKLNLPLTIGVISNTRTEAKVELYKRRFGKTAGAFFVFNSPWDATKTIRNETHLNGQQN